MYQAINPLPRLNKSAAASAPGQTSLQATFVSGNHLNSMAKRIETVAKEAAKLTAYPIADSGEAAPIQVESAASTVLITSETASRNPSASTPASETMYVRTYHQTLVSSGS